MRIIRYLIGALLLYVLISTFVVSFAESKDILVTLFSCSPVVVLTALLIWVYAKGTAVYGTNNMQRSRWFLISVLVLGVIVAFIFSFIQKIETDNARLAIMEN